MADSRGGEPSTSKVSQDIEGSIAAFAAKNGIDEAQTLALIAKHGNDHSILTEHASRLKS